MRKQYMGSKRKISQVNDESAVGFSIGSKGYMGPGIMVFTQMYHYDKIFGNTIL
jgi:hypothetical protein